MKILVVGGGGREHAIIRQLKQNPRVTELFCAPGNGGIAADATCLSIKATDIPAMVEAAKSISADFVVVAPDDPLALGMVDAMNEAGFRTFGPDKAAARIEGSKAFSKDLMKKYGIPTADYECFTNREAAMNYIRQQGKYPVVVKADGLALGKGVVIAQNEQEADQALQQIMEDRIFGDSGNCVVVEEFLTGPEVSVLSFCDGETVVPMVSSMDHKRVYDGNKGPNTGGMGTIAPNPHYTDAVAERCMKEIFLPTVEAMRKEGCPFKGCLYFGLMLTADGPRVIEYNCRFGDPETQVVLPLLDTDLLDIMEAVYDGRLAEMKINWKAEAAACIVLASGGYPGKYQTGIEIGGLDADGQVDGAVVYHAGTKQAEGKYLTAGGRVMGVTATATTLKDALSRAYAAARTIRFEGVHMRSDIGSY